MTRAAQGFGPQTLLGIGGFARVYCGELDGQKVAIKVSKVDMDMVNSDCARPLR